MTAETTSMPNNAAELAEIGTQLYLSLVDGILRAGERGIKLTQSYLTEVDAVQRDARHALEQAAAQARVVQEARGQLATDVAGAAARLIEANRTLTLAFNDVLTAAQQRNAAIMQTAVAETRAAQQETRTRVEETVNRTAAAGAIVLGRRAAQPATATE